MEGIINYFAPNVSQVYHPRDEPRGVRMQTPLWCSRSYTPLECNRICAPPVPKIDPGIMGENRQPLPLGCFPAFRFFFFFIEHILGFEIICYWLLISFLATVQLIFQSVVSVSHLKIIPGFLTNRVMFHVISFAFISSSFLV